MKKGSEVLTGANFRIVRVYALTATLTLFISTIPLSAPHADSSVARASHEAKTNTHTENLRTAREPLDGEAVTTLVLQPAAEPNGEEITEALIMRLMAEAEAADAEAAEKESGGAPPELVARLRSKAVQQALKLRGSRYRYGGTSRGGFDCSGFTRYVYARLGITLPHSSRAQFHCGTPVTRSQLKPGDLVFFARGGRSIGHVGIYIGQNRFVHASNPGRGVVVDSLNSPTYARTYRGARRVYTRD